MEAKLSRFVGMERHSQEVVHGVEGVLASKSNMGHVHMYAEMETFPDSKPGSRAEVIQYHQDG